MNSVVVYNYYSCLSVPSALVEVVCKGMVTSGNFRCNRSVAEVLCSLNVNCSGLQQVKDKYLHCYT